MDSIFIPITEANNSLSGIATGEIESLGLEQGLNSEFLDTSEQLVFVDSAVDNIDELVADIENAKVTILDSDQDGVVQIRDVLSEQNHLDSVHIISHGSAGSIQLGNTVLNRNTLSNYADEIQQWGQSLSGNADLLLYGCNVAKGDNGLAFVNQISQLTQADIAASDDITGQGGDWTLEVTVGNLETDLLINPNNQNTYQGSLATYQGNEYMLTDGAKTWEEAQAEAESLGGNLVTINDAAEEAWLQEKFSKDEELWIGINDIEVEGQFEWSSGETVSYTNWAPGEPSNSGGNQDFGSMNYGVNLQWDDSSPNGQLRGIIEIPQTPSTFTYNGHKYVLTNDAKSWEEAQAEAEALGGNLVTINDAAEENWLKQTFPEDELWIGINDSRVEGKFEWSSGETVSYTNWAPGEPSNSGGNQDFGSMNYGVNRQWDDSSPKAKLQGIIEIPSPSLGSNIVVNGSFENNSIAPNQWGIIDNLEGWTPSIQNGIEVQKLTNLFGSADDGTAWVELDSVGNGGIVQTLQTTPQTSYQLSFAYSPRPNVSSASNEIEVYWNGQLIDKIARQGESSNSWQTYTYKVTANNDKTALEFRATGTSDRLGGFIDNVKVQAISNIPETDPKNGLIGYWQFNEISPSSPIVDASGNNNNGSYVNVNPGITSDSGPINSAPIFETFNPRSGNFDGVDDYVSVSESPELNNSDGTFTQSVWIRPTATDNGSHGILGYQDGSGTVNRTPSLWSYEQTKIRAGFGDGTNWNGFVTGDVLKLNEWNHVVSSSRGNKRSKTLFKQGLRVLR